MIEIPQVVGMTYEEAVEHLAGKWETRISREDSQQFGLTADYRVNRLTFEIDEGKITKCSIG
jgi:hypothetical protein